MGSSESKDTGTGLPPSIQQFATQVQGAHQALGQLGASALQTAQAVAPLANNAMNAYRRAMKMYGPTTGGGYFGVGGGYFGVGGSRTSGGSYFGVGGGADGDGEPSTELKDYEISLAAQTKERVVKKLAEALKSAGIAVNPDADMKTVADILRQALPDPRKGKSFAADAKAQSTICKAVAKALNDAFTPGAGPKDALIDPALGPEGICLKVAEWASSFAAGVNLEFLEVHASLQRVLRNLEALQEILHNARARMLQLVKEKGGPDAEREAVSLEEVFDRAEKERILQYEMLKNLLNVSLGPAKEELRIALLSDEDANARIRRLGIVPGTRGASDAIALAFTGFGTVAAAADQVHRALKKVGLSVRDYLASPNFQDFELLIDEKLAGAKDRDVGGFLEGAQVLRTNFKRRDELAEALKKDTGSVTGSGQSRGIRGGDEISMIDRRVKRQDAERKIIIREFLSKITRNYDSFLAAVKGVTSRLGTEIPLTDRTEALRDALVRLKDVKDDTRIESALVGLYLDADAREKKERFLSALYQVGRAVDAIVELDVYRASAQYFAQIKAAVSTIENTIKLFSDLIAKKYGGDDDGAEFTGGQLDDLQPEISRSTLTLDEAVAEFQQKYFIARVRQNLKVAEKELDEYGKDYSSVLGDAVAARLKVLAGEKKTLLDDVASGVAGSLGALMGTAESKAALRRQIEDVFRTKMDLYRVLQAVDLYLKEFTDGIVRDPNAVLGMKKSLDGASTVQIARWFSETAGNKLAQAFDRMPTLNPAGAAKLADPSGVDHPEGNVDHYYARVARAAAPQQVGVPQFSFAPTQAGPALAPGDGAKRVGDIRRYISDAIDNFQALKNLINSFARIGDTFGGQHIRSKIFLSPAQIYEGLTAYLKGSALSLAMPHRLIPAAPAADIPVRIGGADVPTGVGDAAQDGRVYFGSCIPGLEGNFDVEDKYFAITLKSIAAKVLTVVGVFDLLARPTPIPALTPVRMIIGGADGAVEAIPDAAELYFRLPRFIEFYRGLLWNPASAATQQIAMIPEIEGAYSGLIRLIFQKTEDELTGTYSDTELREITREINVIFTQSRSAHGENANLEALQGLIREINRRYGVVLTSEMKKYSQLVATQRRGAAAFGQYNITNYAILPEEDEPSPHLRAPSDRFMMDVLGALPELKGKFEIDTDFGAGSKLAMLRAFRRKIEEVFNQRESAFTSTSFAPLIQQAKLEMGRSQTQEAKLAVVYRLIQSTSVVGLDADKALMFHETVVVALNILSAIEILLRNFAATLAGLNLKEAEKVLRTGLLALATGGAVPAVIDVTAFAGWQVGWTPLVVRPGAPVSFAERAVPFGVTSDDLYTWMRETLAYHQANAPARAAHAAQLERTIDHFVRYVLDYPRAMREFVENMFALQGATHDLAGVRFIMGEEGTEARLQLDFSKLRSTCETLLADAKHFLDILRPFMPADVVKRFEDLQSIGSIFWLERRLVDVIFRGGDPSDPAARALTLDGMSRTTNEIFVHLVGNKKCNGLNFTIARLQAAGGANVATRGQALAVASAPEDVENYGPTFAGLLFYNAFHQPRSVGVSGGIPYGYDVIGNLVRPRRTDMAPGAAAPAVMVGANATERFLLAEDKAGFTQYRSVLFLYNQLIEKYLTRLLDTASGDKIYGNLVNGFANGVASASVNGALTGKAFPDLVVTGKLGVGLGVLGFPKADAVLFQSLALVLQRLTRDVNPATNINNHLVGTLVDVPLYTKEAFRCYLPAFAKMFDLLVAKCDFIKQFMQKTGVDLRFPSVAATHTTAALNEGAVAAKVAIAIDGGGARLAYTASNGAAVDGANGAAAQQLTGPVGLDVLGGPGDSATTRQRLVNIADAISAGAYALSNASTEVLRELADNPVFMQTQDGFIESYRARYGSLPLMPFSLTLFTLGDVSMAADGRVTDARLTPDAGAGTAEFKRLYGTRLIVYRSTPVTMEQMPGVRTILAAYNAVATRRDQIDSGKFQSFLQGALQLLRFAVDARSFRSEFSTTRTFASVQFTFVAGRVESGIVVNPLPANSQRTGAYSITASPQELVSVAENSNQADEARKISDIVGGATSALRNIQGADSVRARERIANIIDTGLMPINVHALMRGVPFANEYNYSYTFEQYAVSMYGDTVSHIEGLNAATTKNSREMFLRLLVNPYAIVDRGLYGSDIQILPDLIGRLFRGDASLGMGRPKFLSDQLFNKVLFRSIYQTPDVFDEAGPGVGSGFARGSTNNTREGRAQGIVDTIVSTANALVVSIYSVAEPAARGAGGVIGDGAGGDAAAIVAVNAMQADVVAALRTLVAYFDQLIAVLGGSQPANTTGYNAVATEATRLRGVLNGILVNLEGGVVDVATVHSYFVPVGVPGVDVMVPRLVGAPVGLVNLFMALKSGVGGNAANGLDVLSGNVPARAFFMQEGRAGLTYFRPTDATNLNPVIEQVKLPDLTTKQRLEDIGKLRFDTKIVRNLFLITNLARLLRLKMGRELQQIHGVIAENHAMIAPGMTEYGFDPHSPNEYYRSQQWPDGRY